MQDVWIPLTQMYIDQHGHRAWFLVLRCELCGRELRGWHQAPGDDHAHQECTACGTRYCLECEAAPPPVVVRCLECDGTCAWQQADGDDHPHQVCGTCGAEYCRTCGREEAWDD
jgi:hypothetical protein